MMWNMKVFFTFIWFQVHCDVGWYQRTPSQILGHSVTLKREKQDGKWEGATVVAGAQRGLWSGIPIRQSRQCAAGDTLNPLLNHQG